MEPTSQGELAKLNQVIQMDEGKIQAHLGEVVRSTVEERLNVCSAVGSAPRAYRPYGRKKNAMPKIETFTPEWAEYELIDSGAGKKLERFGEFTLVRPEPQAHWKAMLRARRWHAADGEFVKTREERQGEWKFRKATPARWMMRRKHLKFWVRPSPSGHVGV